jgi:sugar phosphate isomerase/epimerase
MMALDRGVSHGFTAGYTALRYAICNEIFANWEHARTCQFVADLGYQGLEVAPFTLAERISDVTVARRRALREQAAAAGVQIIGLHWLLAKTDGFHLTAPDAATRRRTAGYLVELAEACRDLGGELMVLGSPQQRSLPPGVSYAHGLSYATDTLQQALPGIAACGVVLCLEPLGPQETNFLNSCAEAVALIDEIRHPALALHLDVRALSSEGPPLPELVRQFAPRARHVHANDPNRRGPGFGETDFRPLFRELQTAAYRHWVSVEVFDFMPDPETIARESIRYMRACAVGVAEPVR